MFTLLLPIIGIFVVSVSVLLGSVLVVPSWRLRAGWQAAEVTWVVAAFALWLSLEFAWEEHKSLANAALEPVLLAAAIGLFGLLRVAIGPHVSAAAKRWGFLGLSLLSGVLVAYLVKALPE